MVFMKNADRAPLESNPGFEVNPKRDRCTNVLGVGQFGREIYNMTTCILVLKEKQKNKITFTRREGIAFIYYFM